MASGTSDLIVRLSLDTTQFEGALFSVRRNASLRSQPI